MSKQNPSEAAAVPGPALSKLMKETAAQLAALKKLPKKELERKSADIKAMIPYYNARTDSVEERRNKIYDFNLQYLAILITASGVLYAIRTSIDERLLLFVSTFVVLQLFFALLMIFTYELQSRYSYPFLGIKDYSNKWKWFYRGNPFVLQIDRNVFFTRRDDARTTTPYLEGLKFFASMYAAEQLPDEVSDNVQQLYLLQVHSYYKNQFYLDLVRIRLVGLAVSAWLILAELSYVYALPEVLAILARLS